jgi:hypothetical protein
MSETPNGDIVTSHPKATLLTFFTSLLEALSQFIKDNDERKIAITFAPFIALGLMIIFKNYFRRDKCKNLIKIHQSWITSLKEEYHTYGTSPGRKKEIDIEIKGYEAEIKKLQKDSLDIHFN